MYFESIRTLIREFGLVLTQWLMLFAILPHHEGESVMCHRFVCAVGRYLVFWRSVVLNMGQLAPPPPPPPPPPENMRVYAVALVGAMTVALPDHPLPARGWSSWNVLQCGLTESDLWQMAQAMADRGLVAAGACTPWGSGCPRRSGSRKQHLKVASCRVHALQPGRLHHQRPLGQRQPHPRPQGVPIGA